MWRRTEVWLALALVGVLFAVALSGGPLTEGESESRQPSTFLSGPLGAKGLAATLRRLGVPVRQRRRPLFDLAADSAGPGSGELLAFLDIDVPTAPELAAVRDYVGRGGRVFVAGYTGIERCFGYGSEALGRSQYALDSAAVAAPDPDWDLPHTRRVLARLPAESLYERPPDLRRFRGARCAPLFPTRVDTVLATAGKDRRPVALELRFRSGGRALLLADVRYARNRVLKETDAGLFLVPWLLSTRPRWIAVDEYHQGYGRGGSLWGAAARWLISGPPGWAILQLVAVALVALGVSAVRFGPARRVIERRRRSSLEHVEALAAGLEGGGGVDTAVALTLAGLRRRLHRPAVTTLAEERRWLVTLELSLPTAKGRAAARRLKHIATHPGGVERVLDAAQAVEDVWEEMRD